MLGIVMAAVYPSANLYSKSQLPLTSFSIRKVSPKHHLLPCHSLIIRVPIILSASYPHQPSPSSTRFKFNPSTKLFVSGLSFRTTEESLRSAFNNFGELVEVNLMMDKIANRPRGFAFIRYATEEESQKAIEGMHGKFLDGRVIFVEVAKSRSELRRDHNHNSRQ
ncbi:organelle RRM domain-containing protein 6, chloroplastic [Capsicum chacoense]